jgi:hypothetical protein
MSSAGAAPRAAVPVSDARAAVSRQNGAKSRGPKTPEGRARSAQNALRHGMRAQKHLVLPDEDAAEFAELEASMIAELAPVGALQTVLARRVAVAAWRLARADRLETELFEERRTASGGLGLALLGRRVGERGLNPVPAAKGWQRHALVRDTAALSRRGNGRVLARAAHPQGAPGRAGARGRCRFGAPAAVRAAATPRRSRATERTRARRPARTGIPAERTARARHAARDGRPLAAERTRERAACGGGARVPHEP